MDKAKSLSALVEATLVIEKLRVASEVRQTHLANQEIVDPETDELHRRLLSLEEYVDGRIASLIEAHPAYPWFSRVKGVGRENIGKVVAQIDIEKAEYISSLWKFCGYAVVDGHAPKKVKGSKLEYNSQLRSMCWRLGTSLMKARGKFYDYYLKEKEKYQEKYTNQGIKIMPTPKGRFCPNCAKEVKLKAGKYCPTCGGPLAHKEEKGVIFEGHLHNMALRKCIKMFLSCLWLSWREAEGLPITNPYAIDKLGHNHLFKPEDFEDK